MKNERKTIFVIKLIAGLLIIAFWIFLFAWADEKYLLSYNPDYKTEREIILFGIRFVRGRAFGTFINWMCKYESGRYFWTGIMYSSVIFFVAEYIIKKHIRQAKTIIPPLPKDKEKMPFLAAKILAALSLTMLDFVFFMWGIAFLYGGPDGTGINAAAFIGAILFFSLSALFVWGILKIWRFNKKITLATLLLHEIVLFILVAWTSISSIAAGKMTSVIGTLTLAWLLLLAGGYGISKTAKAIKAEAKNEPV